MVEFKDDVFVTSVYRKPTFSGKYQRWDSFAPRSRKIALVDLIVDRAITICSSSTLSKELDNIRKIFQDSGYPIAVVNNTIKNKLLRSTSPKFQGPKKQPVYLCLPYKGIPSEMIAKRVRACVHATYNAVSLKVTFTTRQSLPSSYKDTIPKMSKSNVIYKFTCNHCESEYIGKSSRRLIDRVKEHVPPAIRNPPPPQTGEVKPKNQAHNLRKRRTEVKQLPIPAYNITAVRLHLLENPACASRYKEECFKIIGQAKTPYQLSVLEAMNINCSKPILCRNKQFVYHAKLFNNFLT